MTAGLADTYFWVALLNKDDPYHDKVAGASVPDRLVTTQAIQLEGMNALCPRRLRHLAVQFWQETASNSNVEVVSTGCRLTAARGRAIREAPGQGLVPH